jgi:dolichyl-phosphate-mannose-protein mannosyltransferase
MQEPEREGVTVAGAQAARLTGYFLLLVFFSLGASSIGLKITFKPPQTGSSPGELNLWLGHAFLLFPASLLIGYGFGPQLGGLIRRAAHAVGEMNRRERALGVLALTLFAVAVARLGRHFFLLDLPITDDEYAVDFGGRILASGHVMAPLTVPREVLPGLFLYFRNGSVGSFDWLGGQAVAALAHLTGLGSLVWALVAAVPVPGLAILMGRRLGPPWGLAAAALFLLSPMASLFSMTTHAQLASRALLALALLTFWSADREGGLRRWALTGALLGLAVLCRPLEIVFFSAPLVVWAAIQTIRRVPSYRAALPGLVLGGAVFAAIFLWHSYAMTGNPLLPARFAVPGNTDVTSPGLWTRFAENVAYNVFMLAIWFLGPPGLLLVAFGVLTDRFNKLIGACIVADLCLAFFHDNPGLHVVGPIHYSECAVPLTILATSGLATVLGGASRHHFDARTLSAAIAMSLVLGLGTFTLVQSMALRDSAEGQQRVYDALEGAAQQPGDPKAVVLVPQFSAIREAIPAMRNVGSWVYEWRRPRLDLSDDVLFLRDFRADENVLRSQFPDRRFFRVQADGRSPFLLLVPLAGGEAVPLTSLGVTGQSAGRQ